MEDLLFAFGGAFVLAFVMAGPKARRGQVLPPGAAESSGAKKAGRDPRG